MNTPILDKGYIYVLINPSMEGLVKIGKTNRDPENRVRELSGATGVPTPFILVYKEFFDNCTEAEKQIHVILELHNHRLANNREFFKMPVYEAIEFIQKVKNAEVQIFGINKDETNYKEEDLGLSLLEEGMHYYYGDEEYIQDYTEAMPYFKKAAALGVGLAHLLMGNMYVYGLGCKENFKAAIDSYKAGANAGVSVCYGKLASLYYYETEYKNIENAKKCWENYFKGFNQNQELTFQDYQIINEYSLFTLYSSEMPKYLDIVKSKKHEIFSFLNDELKNVTDPDYKFYLDEIQRFFSQVN